MQKQIFKKTLLAACILSLSACSSFSFFDKDNTPKPKPLTNYKQLVAPRLAWKTSTGKGAGSEYLKLSPSMDAQSIFAANNNGVVTSIAKSNGATNWSVNTGYNLTTGPGVGDGIVAVGSIHGNLIALDESTGRILWRANIKGELIANPAIKSGRVIAKALDGSVIAFSTADGHQLWSFKQSEPDLILRGSSTPIIEQNRVFAGFANGNLASISLSSGDLSWLQQIGVPEGAFAIQRMTDIDADPVINGNRVIAASYQGNIAALDWQSGRTLWSNKISSYTGMSTDDSAVYISDAKSNIWAFDLFGGETNWRQDALGARVVSAPALVGNYVVVGDAEGYVHWLNKHDGSLAARVSIGAAVMAKPLVDNHVVYVLANNGTLAAYQLGY